MRCFSDSPTWCAGFVRGREALRGALPAVLEGFEWAPAEREATGAGRTPCTCQPRPLGSNYT